MGTTLHQLADSQAVIGWIFIITGILAIGFSLFFLGIIKYSFFKGFGIVLLITGSVQIGRGSYTLSTCRNAHFALHANGTVTDEEAFHISEAIRQAGRFAWIGAALAAAGIFLYIAFYRSAQTFWKGIGLGMTIQGLLSAALLRAEIAELKSYKASVTQEVALPDKFRKKIDECRNWYIDFS